MLVWMGFAVVLQIGATALPEQSIPDGEKASAIVRQALIDNKKKIIGTVADFTKVKLKGATQTIKDVTSLGVVVETSFGGGSVSNTTKWAKISSPFILKWVKKAVPKNPRLLPLKRTRSPKRAR